MMMVYVGYVQNALEMNELLILLRSLLTMVLLFFFFTRDHKKGSPTTRNIQKKQDATQKGQIHKISFDKNSPPHEVGVDKKKENFIFINSIIKGRNFRHSRSSLLQESC